MSTPNRHNMQEGPDRVDYQETRDVTEVHASIEREHSDPRASTTPIPVWLTALCGVAVCWAGAYLGVFHGGFSADIYNEYDSSPAALFPVSKKASAGGVGAAASPVSLAQQGKAVYQQCAACHQGSGLGIAGQFPPLVKSEWVTGSEKRLIAILLKGIAGPLNVEGKIYNAPMPAWEKSLSDRKIAAVASYVRSEWGNSGPEISEAKVTSARKEFAARVEQWTEADLLQIPADATLPDAGGAGAAVLVPPALEKKNEPVAAQAVATPGATIAAVVSAVATPEVMAEGKKNYMMVCVACHQPTGAGLPPVFPPLTKTEYVLGDAKRFAAMILKGVAGPMTVDGKLYNNIMPAQESALTDAKIASILTYVRGSFGNSASPVGPEVIAAARKEFAERKTPWSEAELLAFGTDKPAVPEPASSSPPIADAVPVIEIETPQPPPTPALPNAIVNPDATDSGSGNAIPTPSEPSSTAAPNSEPGI